MTKLLNVIIVVLALALVAVILLPQLQANRPRTLRFACDSTVVSLPFLIGVDESTFVQNRIIPELVFYSDPDQALADLFAGKIDVGAFPWSTVFRRILEHGETLKVFLSEDFRQSLPVDAIVVPANSKVKAVADLKKRKLAYPPQMRGYMALFTDSLGLKREDLVTVETPLSELTARLEAGEYDAAWLIEPFVCTLDTTKFRVIQAGALPRNVSAPFPGAAIGFAPGFFGSGKMVLSRLKIATDAAVALAETKPDRAKLILARYFPHCSAAVDLCRIPEFERLAEVNKPAIANLAARLKDTLGVFNQDIETKGIFVEPAKLTR